VVPRERVAFMAFVNDGYHETHKKSPVDSGLRVLRSVPHAQPEPNFTRNGASHFFCDGGQKNDARTVLLSNPLTKMFVP
jgi:hypothetical protein